MTNTIEENNYVGSLLKPLLKKVTPIVGLRMLWELVEAILFYIHFLRGYMVCPFSGDICY
jgi:hypothetical protein